MPIKKVYTDQMGRQVTLPVVPQRIISIVPSQTELLFDLGLGERIVGVTKFCIYPSNKVALVTKVGGTKKLDTSLVRSLKPHLIIANKEENEQAQVEELMQDLPVWISDIHDLPSAIEMIRSIGEITGAGTVSNLMADEIIASFGDLQPANHQTVAYLIWRKPYMLAGQDTFIDDMLKQCGLINVAPANRYPVFTLEQLAILGPQLIFLSSEPYPFKEKHIKELQQYLPNARIILVDGEMFSWYGSRLLQSAVYFKKLMARL